MPCTRDDVFNSFSLEPKMIESERERPQVFRGWEKKTNRLMIRDSCAQQFGFRIRVEEMSTDEEAIQSGSNVARSDSFVTPCKYAIFQFDVHKTPLRNKIFHPFPKRVPDLSSSSAFVRRDSYIEIPSNEAREDQFAFVLLFERGLKVVFLSMHGWAIDIPDPELFFVFFIF